MIDETTRQQVKEKVALLPDSPGVYQFLNAEGVIIYVGKAKNLKRRVSSYFVSRADHTRKVQVMVRQIVDLRHIVVSSEADALLLENNLIKELQPRYNILLKDSKSYPWIVVKNEPFPRIFSTRKFVKDGSSYFGPYSSVTLQRAVLELIRGLYPLRTCKLNLSQQAIARGTYSVCLEYHIGNCKGPCVGLQSETEYAESIAGEHQSFRKALRIPVHKPPFQQLEARRIVPEFGCRIGITGREAVQPVQRLHVRGPEVQVVPPGSNPAAHQKSCAPEGDGRRRHGNMAQGPAGA